MKTILIYLKQLMYLPFYGLSLLPLSFLQFLAKGLKFLLKNGWQYRKKVILTNLINSFPEKTKKEINLIANKFYQNLCDLVAETLKALSISEKELKKRCYLENPELIRPYLAKGKSVIAVLGHCGNWEWAGLCAALHFEQNVTVVYNPLSNRYFDVLMQKIRSRFGVQLVPMNQAMRFYLKNRHIPKICCLVADQSPPPAALNKAYWTTFLHQDTAFQTTPVRLAMKCQHPLVFVHIRRKTRGHYHLHLELLADDYTTVTHEQLYERFVESLTKQIQQQPDNWLWSHRRWKRQRDLDT